MLSEVIMNNTNKQKKPDFTIEFKQSAAKLVNEKGYTHRQAADNLGVSLSAIGRWVRAERGPVAANTSKKKNLIYWNKTNLYDYVKKLNSCEWSAKY